MAPLSPLPRASIAELADDLAALLARIAAGELVASATTIARMEGALVALRAVAGGPVEDLLAGLLGEDGSETL
jgi:hypothetical protein